MILSSAKKALQFAGFINDEGLGDTVSDHEVVAAPTPKPVFVEPKAKGLVNPFIFDPSVHFEVLTELFGVYKGKQTTASFSCPDCDHETTMSFDTPHAFEDWYDTHVHEDCHCTECDYESDVQEFYDGYEQVQVTSLEPSLEDIAYASGIDDGYDRHYDWLYRGTRTVLKNYFEQLSTEGSDEDRLSCPDVFSSYSGIHLKALLNLRGKPKTISGLTAYSMVVDEYGDEGFVVDDDEEGYDDVL